MELIGKRNKALLDEWSIVHASGGIIAAQTGVTLPQFLVLHTIFEIVENADKGKGLLSKIGWDRKGGDTFTNVLGDTISAAAGWYLGQVTRDR